jgi:hypothetical protein
MLKCSQRGSHSTLSLDFSQITHTSLRGEGKRSKKAQGRIFSLVEPAALEGGKGRRFYTIPQKLAIEN